MDAVCVDIAEHFYSTVDLACYGDFGQRI